MTQEECSYQGCNKNAATTLDLEDQDEPVPTCAEHASNLADGDNGETSGDRPVLTQPGEDEGAAWLNTDKNSNVYLSVKIEDEYHNFYPQNPLLQWAFQATHKVTQQ